MPPIPIGLPPEKLPSLMYGFCYRPPLRRQNLKLPQLGDNLCRLVSLLAHSSVLNRLKNNTSGRTTFQGADQYSSASCGSRSDHYA